MIDIVINKDAYDAIRWASSKFGQSSFQVRHTWPSDRWCFSFNTPDQASLFALKWAS